jgi:hypothetical protein
MLHGVLIVLGLYGLCWGYTRLQMYCWYGPKASTSSQSSGSPFVIKAACETVPTESDVDRHRLPSPRCSTRVVSG